MAYSLSNISTKNYWIRTTTVELSLVVEGYTFLKHSVVCNITATIILRPLDFVWDYPGDPVPER